jgi:hypothetical protein
LVSPVEKKMRTKKKKKEKGKKRKEEKSKLACPVPPEEKKWQATSADRGSTPATLRCTVTTQ